MRYAWSKSSFIGGALMVMALLTTAVSAQQKVNPVSGINWPAATGSGAPTAGCTSANYGQPYTDTTGNVQYNCSASGWISGGGGSGNIFTSIILTTVGGETTLTAGGIDTDGGDYEINVTGANTDINTGDLNVNATGVIRFNGIFGCLFAASADGQISGNSQACLTPVGPSGAIQFNAGSGFLNGTASLTTDTSGNVIGAGDSSFHISNASEGMIVTSHTTTGGYFEAYNDECDTGATSVPASQVFLTTGNVEESLNISVASRCSTGINSFKANAGSINPTGTNDLWIFPEFAGGPTIEGGHIYFAQALGAGELMHYGGHLGTDNPTGQDIFYPGMKGGFFYGDPVRGELVPAPTTALTTTINGTACAISGSCTLSIGMTNPMTGVGDFIRGGTSGAPTRLAAPTVAGSYMITETPTGTPAVPVWLPVPMTITSGSGTFLTGYDTSTGLFASHAITAAMLPVFIASGASHAPGAVPDPGATAGTTKFLREDSTWQVPPTGPATAPPNTVYGNATGSTAAPGFTSAPVVSSVGTLAANVLSTFTSTLPATHFPMATFVGGTVGGGDSNFTLQVADAGTNNTTLIPSQLELSNDQTPTDTNSSQLYLKSDGSIFTTLHGVANSGAPNITICAGLTICGLTINSAGSVTSPKTITSNLGTAAITSANGAPGVTSVTCVTANCTVYRGTYTVVGGTATTGTFVTLVWPTTTTAWGCEASMNGGGSPSVGFLGIGHSVATATGMTLSAAVTILGVTFTFDYSCQP